MDIPYIRILQGVYYLILITGTKSRKTVVHALHHTLEGIGCVEAQNNAVHLRNKNSLYFRI